MPYRAIAILTGAGISAESGIKTFRDASGMWEQYRIEEVATPEAYVRNPRLVHDFYNARRRQLATVQPNPAHRALAELGERFPGEVTVVTQNIDDLHERAGSRQVIHMHGELLKIRCVRSGTVVPAMRDVGPDDRCACCHPPSPLRPHVVWFGEAPLELERIFATLSRCDLFLAIGTSGLVYPAAGFVEMAGAAGAHTVELNLEPSAVSEAFTERIYGPATQVVPAYVQRLLVMGQYG